MVWFCKYFDFLKLKLKFNPNSSSIWWEYCLRCFHSQWKTQHFRQNQVGFHFANPTPTIIKIRLDCLKIWISWSSIWTLTLLQLQIDENSVIYAPIYHPKLIKIMSHYLTIRSRRSIFMPPLDTTTTTQSCTCHINPTPETP